MDKRIDKLKQEQQNTQKQFDKELKKLRDRINKLQQKMDILNKESSKLYFESRKKHYYYEEKIQKICKHDKYPVRKRENMRDDASFKYWVSCSCCGIDLRHE